MSDILEKFSAQGGPRNSLKGRTCGLSMFSQLSDRRNEARIDVLTTMPFSFAKAFLAAEKGGEKPKEPSRPHILEALDVERSRGSVGSHSYVRQAA